MPCSFYRQRLLQQVFGVGNESKTQFRFI
jgi:hypothetical protein